MQYFFIIVDMSAFKHKNYSIQLWKGNAEENNFRKVEKWADKIGVKTINVKIDKFDPFFNINTKTDLKEAEKILIEYKND